MYVFLGVEGGHLNELSFLLALLKWSCHVPQPKAGQSFWSHAMIILVLAQEVVWVFFLFWNGPNVSQHGDICSELGVKPKMHAVIHMYPETQHYYLSPETGRPWVQVPDIQWLTLSISGQTWGGYISQWFLSGTATWGDVGRVKCDGQISHPLGCACLVGV